MTIDYVIDLITQEVKLAKGLRRLANLWNVSPAYLSDVINKRKTPGPKILRALRLKKQVVYVRTDQENGHAMG